MMTQITLDDLTDKQQEILLQGLRFVRSHVAMECRQPPSDSIDAQRRENYAQIDELESIIQKRKLPQKG